jgi:chromosome segregation ATPase
MSMLEKNVASLEECFTRHTQIAYTLKEEINNLDTKVETSHDVLDQHNDRMDELNERINVELVINNFKELKNLIDTHESKLITLSQNIIDVSAKLDTKADKRRARNASADQK